MENAGQENTGATRFRTTPAMARRGTTPSPFSRMATSQSPQSPVAPQRGPPPSVVHLQRPVAPPAGDTAAEAHEPKRHRGEERTTTRIADGDENVTPLGTGPGPPQNGRVRNVLVFAWIRRGQPPAIAATEGHLPTELVSSQRRDTATDWADMCIPQLIDITGPPPAVLAAEFDQGEYADDVLTRVVVATTGQEARPRPPWTWHRTEDLGKEASLASAVALSKVRALSNHDVGHCVMGHFDAGGAGGPRLLPPPEAQMADEEAFRRIADMALAEQALLKLELEFAEDEPGDEGYLASWARRVATGPGPDDVPRHLRNGRDALLDEAPGLPFDIPFTPPTTAPRPTPPPQRTSYKPRSVDDIITQEGRDLINDWIQRHSAAVQRAWAAGPGTPINFREPLVIGQEYVVPEARGIYWDLQEGQPHPIDYTKKPESHLDLAWFVAELRRINWPDEEILSFLTDGVQFKADLGFDCVLMPHLKSLENGLHRIDGDLQKLRDKGYYKVMSRLSHFPIRLAPAGSRERKLEKSRPRCIEDQGAPRKPLYSTAPSGVPGRQTMLDTMIPSLNEAIDMRGIDQEGQPKWPPEEKPTIPQIARNNLILRSAARATGTVVFVFGDDAANAFNQVPTWEGERWKTARFWRSWKQDETWAILVAQTLGFGISTASNVMQRISGAIVAPVDKEMEWLEEQHPPTPAEQIWLHERKERLERMGIRTKEEIKEYVSLTIRKKVVDRGNLSR